MSDSLWPHGVQHARLFCPSLSPQVCSNSCPLSRWCHPTIPSSATPFSFCPQSFPASRSFPMSWHSFRRGETGVPCSPQISVLLGVSGLPQGNPHPRSGTAAWWMSLWDGMEVQISHCLAETMPVPSTCPEKCLVVWNFAFQQSEEDFK